MAERMGRPPKRRSPGSGALRQLGSGRWQARFRAEDGGWRSRTFDQKGHAVAWLAELRSADARGVLPRLEASRTTVGVVAEQWFTSKTRLTPKTAATYRGVLDRLVLPRFKTMPITRLSRASVRDWVADLERRKLSASQVRQAMQTISQVLDYAVDAQLIAANPTVGLKRPEMPAPEPVILTENEVEKLAKAAGLEEVSAPSWAPLMIRLLAFSGLRVGEVVVLRRRHVVQVPVQGLRVEDGVTEVSGRQVFGGTKSHQQRLVPLAGIAWDALTAHLESLSDDSETLLFPSVRTGGVVRYNTLRRWWDDAVAHSKLTSSPTPHSLRASCASWIAGESGPLVAAAILGHSNASVTTRHYARPLPGATVTAAKRLAKTFEEASQRSVSPVAQGDFPTPERHTNGTDSVEDAKSGTAVGL